MSRHRICLDLLPPHVDRLLDVGCGGGGLAYDSMERFTSYYGVDVSPWLLNIASANLTRVLGRERVNLVNSDVDRGLPFDSSSFDAVSCIAVLEHVVNPPQLIEEIYRVLKPNGTLVLSVPNIAWLPLRIRLLLGVLPTTGGMYLGADWEHLHIFTKGVITNLLDKKGFEVEIVTCSGVLSRYRRTWVSLLGGDVIVKCRRMKV